jgi:hypothetical protein
VLFHPLSIAVILADLVSLYFLFPVLYLSIRFLLQETMDDKESVFSAMHLGTVTRNGRFVLVLQSVSFLLILFGFSFIFPPILTGIMCGAGVLQISGETGSRMLLVKMGVLLVLYLWYQIDLANRELPQKNLSMATSKAMLCCVPFVLLGVWLTIKTLWVMNLGQSGNCCTIAYGASAAGGFSFNPVVWLPLLAVLSIVLLLLALLGISKRQLSQHLITYLLCSALLWCLVALMCLRYFFSAYYYGVTQHHCLWCLFLPGNYSVGYPFFFIMAIMLSQGISVFVHGRIVLSQPGLSDWVGQKIRQSGWMIIAGMISYFLLTLIPIVFWKIQHGIWSV